MLGCLCVIGGKFSTSAPGFARRAAAQRGRRGAVVRVARGAEQSQADGRAGC